MAQFLSGASGYYEQDGLESVTTLSGATASIRNSYTYDSFGNLIASTGSAANPFQYTGRDFDSETGLRYYRARYYDPELGRFIGEDPILFKGGNNFFAYVQNNPQNFDDPTGLYSLQGFNAEQQIDMMNAIEQIREKLEQCPSCVSDPKLRSKLLEFIAQGNNGSGVTFIFKERLNEGHCGDTRGITNTTYLSDWRNQFGCYCLPKTIIHELVHQTWKNIFIPGISDWAEKEPDMVDHDCFPLSKCHSWMGAKH